MINEIILIMTVYLLGIVLIIATILVLLFMDWVLFDHYFRDRLDEKIKKWRDKECEN